MKGTEAMLPVKRLTCDDVLALETCFGFENFAFVIYLHI